MRGHNWAAAAAVVLGSAALFAMLEWAAKLLAPPQAEDPRLGAATFWIWVASVALATYVAVPFFEEADGPLELLSLSLGVLGWLGWKLGLNEGWEDSPREREEIWATTVGSFAGLIVRSMVA